MTGKIVYVEDWYGRGEHYVFAIKTENGWGLDTAFKLRDDDQGEATLLHYTALTKIRDWIDRGIKFHFE